MTDMLPFVSNIADLASSTAAGSVLVEGYASPGDGGEGVFTWSGSNLSTEVSNDYAHGIYVPPSSDTTGASGAWVRAFSGLADVRWFGAVADNSTDNTDALNHMIEALNAGLISSMFFQNV